MGRGVGAPALSKGKVCSGFGEWSLAADEGQVPGVPLSPCQAGVASAEPCWGGHACSFLMPTVALKVSSVLEGSMLVLALNPGKAKVQ